MTLQSCRSCLDTLQRLPRQTLKISLSSSGRSLHTATSVATTSRVTLASPQFTRSSANSTFSKRPAAAVLLSWPSSTAQRSPTRFADFRRGMATITRQPEAPEEPEVFSGGEAPSIILTDRAIQHLAKVSAKENNPDLALRIAVEPGGCHGYQYKMEITTDIEEDDFRFSSGDNVHLVIDSTSLRLIKGSTIDYVTELIGSQFAILNNPQAKGAGCGCGVSWEPIV